MSPDPSDASVPVALEHAELSALSARIIDSGVLGKSRVYAKILCYLVDCSIRSISPKETSIAIDVLERGVDFDVSRDSIVRVHMFQLRSKLEKYFREFGAQERLHIAIPKGQYGLVVTSAGGEAMSPSAAAVADIAAADIDARWPRRLRPVVMLLAVSVLAAGAYRLGASVRETAPAAEPAALQQTSGFGFWDNIVDDGLPVQVLVGDYYIFGELDENRGIARMVRDFGIESRADFDRRARSDEGFGLRHADLGLSYLPTGVAPALVALTHFLAHRSPALEVKLMSEFDPADMASHHIIYIGLFSSLGELHDLVFAASGLYLGNTYDELHEVATDAHHVSSYHNPASADGFRDYGLLSAFTGPRGNQFVMFMGMRDAALRNLVEQATSDEQLGALAEALELQPADMHAFEALYEVSGLQATNFSSRLRHRQLLDSEVIWEARLVRGQPYR